MLRRRSEFFLFLDDARARKSGKEEQKEERYPSPCEDYLGVLLQMKMTSDVSQQTAFPQVCSAPTGIKRKLEIPLNSTYMLLQAGVFFLLSMSEKFFQLTWLTTWRRQFAAAAIRVWILNCNLATSDAGSSCSRGCTGTCFVFLCLFVFRSAEAKYTCTHTDMHS